MAVAALLAASCATEESSNSLTANRPIRFSANTASETVTRSDLQSQQLEGYVKPLWLAPVVTTTLEPATRGTQLNSGSTLESFGVSAYLHPTDAGIANVKPTYFYNKQATPVPNDPNGNYALSQDYYWPASTEALTFYAYAPYGNSNAVISDDDVEGPQTIRFTVASNVTEQIDLMTATAFKQTPSTTETPSVGLTFKHELTGVRFVIGDQFLAGWIKSITLKNVYGKGTMTIGSTSSWTLSNKTDFSVSYNTDRPVTGEANEAVTTASETFLMIPQTLGGTGQEVEIVYQDAAHTDYTVSAPLTGTWEAGKTVTYAISSTDLTTLRIGTINFPVISGSPKTAWENKDSVGLYVVGSNGTELIHRNIKCTYDGTKWNIAHPATPIYDLPGQTYFFYYPYSAASSGQPLGYPEAATSADESADDFFANVIAQHPIATNQSSYDNFVNSDLCIAKATHTTDASTISATLVRKVGLAVIELASKTIPTTITYTNNGSGEESGSTDVTASSTFSGNTPYNNSTAYYAFVKANTNTSFSSATYSDSNKDAWEASLVFNIAAGASDSKTAYSRRYNYEYINAIWNYEYSGKVKRFEAPITGTYTIKCWGAQGGNSKGNGNTWTNNWGLGGYTVGDINLTADEELYVCVGGKGANGVVGNHSAGGWNGGGRGTWDGEDDEVSGGGGGATDIRLDATAESATWNTFSSLLSRIMVAAGGGGMAWYPSYQGSSGYGAYPGYGGGLSGGDAIHYQTSAVCASGATQESGGAFGYGKDGLTGYGNVGIGGGGGGYYGGTFSTAKDVNTNSGSGGSSFISGLTGCQAYESTSTSSNMIKRTGDNATKHYSGKVFTDASTIAGNASQPQPDGSTKTGHSGNGYCRITLTRW